MKKTTPPKEKRSPSHGNHGASASRTELLDKAPTKIARVLIYLRHFGALNRFEAARFAGDTCLNSTIPALERRGLAFDHIAEKSSNSWGEPCDVTRYRLPLSEQSKADKVLVMMFERANKAKDYLRQVRALVAPEAQGGVQ